MCKMCAACRHFDRERNTGYVCDNKRSTKYRQSVCFADVCAYFEVNEDEYEYYTTSKGYVLTKKY